MKRNTSEPWQVSVWAMLVHTLPMKSRERLADEEFHILPLIPALFLTSLIVIVILRAGHKKAAFTAFYCPTVWVGDRDNIHPPVKLIISVSAFSLTFLLITYITFTSIFISSY